jgi:hypothetical protein
MSVNIYGISPGSLIVTSGVTLYTLKSFMALVVVLGDSSKVVADASTLSLRKR